MILLCSMRILHSVPNFLIDIFHHLLHCLFCLLNIRQRHIETQGIIEAAMYLLDSPGSRNSLVR